METPLITPLQTATRTCTASKHWERTCCCQLCQWKVASGCCNDKDTLMKCHSPNRSCHRKQQLETTSKTNSLSWAWKGHCQKSSIKIPYTKMLLQESKKQGSAHWKKKIAADWREKTPHIEDSSSNDSYKIWGGGRGMMTHRYVSPPILVPSMILDSFPKEAEIENFRSSGWTGP